VSLYYYVSVVFCVVVIFLEMSQISLLAAALEREKGVLQEKLDRLGMVMVKEANETKIPYKPLSDSVEIIPVGHVLWEYDGGSVIITNKSAENYANLEGELLLSSGTKLEDVLKDQKLIKRGKVNKTLYTASVVSKKLAPYFNQSGGSNHIFHRFNNISNASPIPARMNCKLRYAEERNMGAAATVLDTYQFRMNSVFDPNSTGTGHQPLGFDQLAALYLRYVVKSFNCVIKVSQGTAFSRMAFALVNNSLTPTVFEELVERLGAKWMYLGTQYETVHSQGVDLWKLNGVNLETYLTDDRYSAVVSTNPTEVMNLILGYECSAATCATWVTVELEYDVDFFDPVALAQS